MYNLSDSLRVKIHQEYFQTILYRDLIERYDILHPKALRDLAYQLIDNDASFSRSNANPKKINTGVRNNARRKNS